MSMNRAFPILACALLSGGIVASDAHAQLTTAEIVREVVPAIEGVPAGIEGALIYEEKRNRTDFSIVVEGLPIGAYAVCSKLGVVAYAASASRPLDAPEVRAVLQAL